MPSDPVGPPIDSPFVTYEMADGSEVYGEYQFVTDTEWWDDREEEIVLPDPYPIEDDDAE